MSDPCVNTQYGMSCLSDGSCSAAGRSTKKPAAVRAASWVVASPPDRWVKPCAQFPPKKSARRTTKTCSIGQSVAGLASPSSGADQNGQVNYASESILSRLNTKEVESMKFEDIFDKKKYSEFLIDIDFENSKDMKVDVSLTLMGESEEEVNFQAISGSKENEDGTINIFLIQQ